MTYRVPTMEEVREVEGTKGLVVASTFTGAGGSSLGWRMAGYDVRYGNDVDPDTWESYEANKAEGATLDRRSIREVAAEDVLEACGVERGELDVLEGSPPCTQFSMLGKRAGGWGDVVKHAGIEQRVDDLFFEYVRLVEGCLPRAFVAENVEGLARGVARGYMQEILEALRRVGYLVGAKVVDAQWLGIPQHRTRVIVVGVRHDVGAEVAFPRPHHRLVGAREALAIDGWDPDRTYLRSRGYRSGGIASRGSSFVGWKDLLTPIGRPSPTVTATGLGGAAASQAWVEHHPLPPDRGAPKPVERRHLELDEVKGLCSFPADFDLSGAYTQQWARLGNSVPPLMTKAIAEALAPALTEGRKA